MAVAQLWARARLCGKALALHKVRIEVNPAGRLAKCLESSKIMQHLAALSLRPDGGRPTPAPRMAAEVETLFGHCGI